MTHFSHPSYKKIINGTDNVILCCDKYIHSANALNPDHLILPYTFLTIEQETKEIFTRFSCDSKALSLVGSKVEII